jgi:hypothetical protein
MPSGCYPVTRRGATIDLYLYMAIKIAAYCWATSYALECLNGANIRRIFETCKHFRYFLREFKKKPTHAIAA